MVFTVVEISKRYREKHPEEYKKYQREYHKEYNKTYINKNINTNIIQDPEYQKAYHKTYIRKKNYYIDNEKNIKIAKARYLWQKESKIFLNILL